MSSDEPIHLITFLGTQRYSITTYEWAESNADSHEQRYKTEFVAEAVCHLLPVCRVTVIATETSRQKYWDTLSQRLQQNPSSPDDIDLKLVDERFDNKALWEQFQTVLDALRGRDGADTTEANIVLDITHGWRSLPFFAGSVVEFALANDLAAAPVRVLYGEYRDNPPSPIHDLTLTLDVLRWSRGINFFRRSGNAADVVEPTQALGNELSRAWAESEKQGEKPPLEKLAKHIQAFSDDLVTVRSAALMYGHGSSAAQLCKTICECRESVKKLLPPLASVLDQLKNMAEPLVTHKRFSQQSGQRAMANLAKLYLDLGRFAEAAAVIREAEICQHACEQADMPGADQGYSDKHRQAAEQDWYQADENHAKSIGQFRNDIEHAGFNKQPAPGRKLKCKIKKMVNTFDRNTHDIDESPS